LVSPVYFSHDAIWIRPPDQKVNANTMTRASFGREMFEYDFTVALLYKLQRKSLESNTDNIKDTSTNLQLLVIWRSNSLLSFFSRALLIKSSNTITWDEDKLRKLYSMNISLFRDDNIVKNTCLLDGATVLMATPKRSELSRVTEITISEKSGEDFTVSLFL
jgi:hypothetical protein